MKRREFMHLLAALAAVPVVAKKADLPQSFLDGWAEYQGKIGWWTSTTPYKAGQTIRHGGQDYRITAVNDPVPLATIHNPGRIA